MAPKKQGMSQSVKDTPKTASKSKSRAFTSAYGTATERQSSEDVSDEQSADSVQAASSSRKRKTPSSKPVAAPPPKRRAAVTPSGSPVVISDDGDEESSEVLSNESGDAGESGVEQSSPEPPPKPSKSKGKALATSIKSTAAMKRSAKKRAVAVAGPEQNVHNSVIGSVRMNVGYILNRSRVDISSDLAFLNDSKVIWEVCERYTTHLDEGKQTLRFRYGYDIVLIYTYRL